jgi:hypothetical protein
LHFGLQHIFNCVGWGAGTGAGTGAGAGTDKFAAIVGFLNILINLL